MFKGTTIDDIAIPSLVILGAMLLGFLAQKLLIGYLSRRAEKNRWRTGTRLISSLRGMMPIWLGLIAAESVLDEFPLRAAAVRDLEKAFSIITVLTFTIVIARIAVTIIRLYSINKRDASVPAISLVENIARTVVIILGALMIFHSLGVSVTPILTALGVGGLAVALALQDTLSNFFAGIYIILSRQITIGDYIKISTGEEGFINDIAWRVTTMRTNLGSLIIVPNSKLSSSIVTNYDRPIKENRLRIDFDIKYEHIKEFEEALTRAALEAAKEVTLMVPEHAPIVRYCAATDEKATLSLIVTLQDYALRDTVRDLILRKMIRYKSVSKEIPEPNENLTKENAKEKEDDDSKFFAPT